MRWLRMLLILFVVITFVTGFTQLDKAVQSMLDWNYQPAFQLKPYPPEPKVIIWREEITLPAWMEIPSIQNLRLSIGSQGTVSRAPND